MGWESQLKEDRSTTSASSRAAAGEKDKKRTAQNAGERQSKDVGV
jgi:hypothetical protein